MEDNTKMLQRSKHDILADLSKEDINFLINRWGIGNENTDDELFDLYRMQLMYDEYENEYEMGIDREQTLKNICKVSVKMDHALEDNDIDTYRKLSMVYDQLRKSGKFTEAQKKEKKAREIDSIGELVSFVEMNSGAIPDITNPIDEPQDKIDFMIRDMKRYIDNLVKNELGLSNLIESYIKKADKNKVQSVDEMMAQDDSYVGDDGIVYEPGDTIDDIIYKQIQQEAMGLSEKYRAQ